MRTVRTPPASSSTPRAPLTARRARIQQDASRALQESLSSGKLIVSATTDEISVATVLDKVPRERREKRKGDYVHVSDLLTKCVRKIALCDKHGIPVMPDRLSTSDKLTFAQGDAIHDTIKSMATSSDARQVWGNWSCDCGYLYHDDPCTHDKTDPNDFCPQCDTPTNKYHEVPMYDDELMIVGTPDLLRWIRVVEAFHVTEIKSMAHDAWKELSRPVPAHVMQVLFYWYLMHKLGYRMVDRVSLVYVTKGYIFTGEKPYKEFIIDPIKELARLEPYLEDARMIKLSKTTNAFPARTECAGPLVTKARKCEACEICFATN